MGMSVLLGSISPFFVVPVFVLITNKWYISFEEKNLERKSGSEYRKYQARVRRWI
jgi:protein-S-isoprenylcysteine O-methyltransferase Ste14